jgi:hypothetical protein
MNVVVFRLYRASDVLRLRLPGYFQDDGNPHEDLIEEEFPNVNILQVLEETSSTRPSQVPENLGALLDEQSLLRAMREHEPFRHLVAAIIREAGAVGGGREGGSDYKASYFLDMARIMPLDVDLNRQLNVGGELALFTSPWIEQVFLPALVTARKKVKEHASRTRGARYDKQILPGSAVASNDLADYIEGVYEFISGGIADGYKDILVLAYH